jgi:site-specific recombinase XerD
MDKPLDVMTETHQQLPSKWSVSSGIQNIQAPDILALPENLTELPEWLREPLRRFLRLKQRNWPAKTVQRSTRQLFSRMNYMITFFIQRHNWSEWSQLSPRWLENYIDARLREQISPGTINWDLNNFRVLCRFLIEEGHPINESILRMKLLDTPRRLPRPLSAQQVRRLERSIQKAIIEAKDELRLELAVRDLACLYLLWHCGLRISEVCSLLLHEIDLEARKIFIRNSKERKDRVVYISDTTAMVLQQYLAIRSNQGSSHLFPTRRGIMTTRTLQRRLADYGQQCDVPVTAQRLRHTFASQMLTAGMPVTSLQRYLGHQYLDTTMLYAEVADPLLQKDYYQGIAALDPDSENLPSRVLGASQQQILRKLVDDLKRPDLTTTRRNEILEHMQHLLESVEEK